MYSRFLLPDVKVFYVSGNAYCLRCYHFTVSKQAKHEIKLVAGILKATFLQLFVLNTI